LPRGDLRDNPASPPTILQTVYPPASNEMVAPTMSLWLAGAGRAV
jgi:hypothetical protein